MEDIVHLSHEQHIVAELMKDYASRNEISPKTLNNMNQSQYNRLFKDANNECFKLAKSRKYTPPRPSGVLC